MPLVVQKYGGTSVADPDRMRAVADNVAFTRRHGNDVVVVASAMGKSTDNLIALAAQVSETARRPGDGHAPHDRGACRRGAVDDGSPRPRRGRREFHREPGRDHHRHEPRQGQDRRRQGRSGARRARRRQGRRRRRVPGGEHREGGHDDGPRRLRPHGDGPGQRPRRRRLRDLHRRDRGVLGRPAHRPAGPQVEPGELRRDAGDGRVRLQGARPEICRVRPQPRRRFARAVELHVGAGHVDRQQRREGGRAWRIRSSRGSSPT